MTEMSDHATARHILAKIPVARRKKENRGSLVIAHDRIKGSVSHEACQELFFNIRLIGTPRKSWIHELPP
jgi:hypothetical protein